MTIVLVDARNVLRSEWPNIPEQLLVALCRAWAEREGVRVVVAFDGSAPEGLVGERELDSNCLLVGTGSESADEWLDRAAAECRRSRDPHWLVTSDRGLRATAGHGAERLIGGGSFARLLRRLEA